MRSKLLEAAPMIKNMMVSSLTAIFLFTSIISLYRGEKVGWVLQLGSPDCSVQTVSVGIDQYLRCSALSANVVIILHKELSPTSQYSLSSLLSLYSRNT